MAEDNKAVAKVTRELSNERRTTGYNTDGLWSFVVSKAPEVADALSLGGYGGESELGLDLPGFRHWLYVNYALNVPSTHIRRLIEGIQKDQKKDGVANPWPVLTKSQLDTIKAATSLEWRPIAERIEDGIEQTGVLAKNRRLLALLRMADTVEEMMFDERNAKTAQLYLLPEYRQILRQIAEEKGELGEGEQTAENVLGEIALTLTKALGLQGSGIQTAKELPSDDVYWRELDEAEA